jgi:hypothetical protein
LVKHVTKFTKFTKTRYQILPKAKIYQHFSKNYQFGLPKIYQSLYEKKFLILHSDAIFEIYVFIKIKDFGQCVEGHSMEFGTILEHA